MKLEEKMKQSLIKALETENIYFENFSFMHVGHATLIDNKSNETHFKVSIKSKKFNGLNRIQRQKLVYKVVNYAFLQGLHALELSCESDNE